MLLGYLYLLRSLYTKYDKFLIENMIIRLITCGAGYINLLGDNKKK